MQEFEGAIESFYQEYGTIENLTVYSHMYKEGINLGEGFVFAEDLESIEADIDSVKLAGCRAGEAVPGGENIAQSFANVFDATVTASPSGTWFVGRQGQGLRDSLTNRYLLTLEPRGGEWVEFIPENSN